MSRKDHSHARKNLLTGEWVLVSPHRTQRPWQGQTESVESMSEPAHDPDCYLCAGNKRVNGETNPNYSGPFIFDNDFPALSAASEIADSNNALFRVRSEEGRCRVVCFSEQHNQRLATMSLQDVAAALQAMFADFVALERTGAYEYVQVFENRGAMMGCSNQHPHAQIWATENLPTEPAKELIAQREYLAVHGSCLLCDYRDAELEEGTRVVHANRHFATLVPFWATWPFEQMILPMAEITEPGTFSDDEIAALAEILKVALSANDRLFETSAPYSMGFHPRPADGAEHPEWLFHIHIYPPLLRSATIRKHLVGFEMLGMPQRDLTPEVAAERLRACIDL